MTDVVYILSVSHSGSTLLAMLLGAHPDACTVGELKATSLGDTDRYRCSCGALIKQCTFWANVSQGMARRGITFDITQAETSFQGIASRYANRLLRCLHRGPSLEKTRDATLWLSPTWRAQLPRLQRRNAVLMQTICELTLSRVIIDSSKIAVRLKYLLRNPALTVTVIRLIRDARAVTFAHTDPASYADAADPRFRDGGMGGARANERLSVSDGAWEWRRSNEEAERLLSRLDRLRHISVHYEELCLHPEGVLRRLFTFLRLDPSRAVRSFRSVEHHVLGNGMRFDATLEIRLDERWRTVLSQNDLRTIDSVAGHLQRRYGYTQ